MTTATQARGETSATRDVIADGSDVRLWLEEARRLFDEAEGRLATGSPLSALSSLVAVPPLHRLIVDRCSTMLDLDADESLGCNEPHMGLYL